ncbi:pyrroline-5-carboxylate reductase [Cladophialophora carrionii CBS 160.54]|uniref:Pyrroline-5-carboxylate reductase n=1 Tax=Cladophialophora carrionii CBS 160.54 TaxID=1279043 RepID=V9D400_9EURO|nr:pyrroline-5-carboxylate reductase [Cladophialophora carrionii CBS 160.54]ETI21008.1 pyrroline-5-carboxylate reductase [Cladophialophora carrionii CBS 160.54]
MSPRENPSEPGTLRIAILGCGFIGTAVLSGILKDIDTTTHNLKFSLSAASQTTLDRLRHKFASQRYRDHVDVITADNATAARDADVVILAFQPHQLAQVLSDTVLVEILRPKLIISLLAGVSCREILDKLSPGGLGVSDGSKAESETSSAQTGQPAPPRIARAIPSIGAQIKESATLLAGDTDLSGPDQGLVTWLFGLVGAMHVVPERLLNAVTAISAATHALAVVAVDAIVDGGVVSGVSRPVAMAVATQCLRSASTLVRGGDEDGMTIEGLKEAMSIPRGITINALLELERGRVRAGISDAVRYAVGYAEGM